MAIKNLIVLTDSREGCRGRVDVALLMAQKYDAHLTGVYVATVERMGEQVYQYLPNIDRELIEKNIEDKQLELSTAARTLFEDAARATGWLEKSHWKVVRGDPDSAVGIVGRYADLTIAGQRDESGAGAGIVHPDHVVFDSGRPLLIVPDSFSAPAKLIEHAVVGWDGSREAARALADAMLILETKSKVSVVTIGSAPAMEKAMELSIVEHLERHGIEAEGVSIAHKESDAGLDLLTYAESVGAGLLVMGAYSKSRLREQILGGATRSVLRQMSVPVLMSH